MRGGTASVLEKPDLNLVPLIKQNYFIDLNIPDHFYALIKTLIDLTSHLKSLYTENQAMWIRKGEPGYCPVEGWNAYYKKGCPFYDQLGNEVYWIDSKLKGEEYRDWKYKSNNKLLEYIPQQPDVWKLLDIDVEGTEGFKIVKYKSPDLAKPTLKLIYWWLDQAMVEKKAKNSQDWKTKKVENTKQFYESRKAFFTGEEFHTTLYTNIINTITDTDPKTFVDVQTLINDKIQSISAVIHDVSAITWGDLGQFYN
jgi:hypothetical protein